MPWSLQKSVTFEVDGEEVLHELIYVGFYTLELENLVKDDWGDWTISFCSPDHWKMIIDLSSAELLEVIEFTDFSLLIACTEILDARNAYREEVQENLNFNPSKN